MYFFFLLLFPRFRLGTSQGGGSRLGQAAWPSSSGSHGWLTRTEPQESYGWFVGLPAPRLNQWFNHEVHGAGSWGWFIRLVHRAVSYGWFIPYHTANMNHRAGSWGWSMGLVIGAGDWGEGISKKKKKKYRHREEVRQKNVREPRGSHVCHRDSVTSRRFVTKGRFAFARCQLGVT